MGVLGLKANSFALFGWSFSLPTSVQICVNSLKDSPLFWYDPQLSCFNSMNSSEISMVEFIEEGTKGMMEGTIYLLSNRGVFRYEIDLQTKKTNLKDVTGENSNLFSNF